MTAGRRTTKRRILVVANATAESATVHEAIRDRVRGSEAEVLVIAAARDLHRGPWTLDDDSAFGATEERLLRCLDLLDASGIEANGVVADSDSLLAIVDALQGFPADEVVLVAEPNACSPRVRRRVHVVDGSSDAA
jgi:hypothetical protein